MQSFMHIDIMLYHTSADIWKDKAGVVAGFIVINNYSNKQETTPVLSLNVVRHVESFSVDRKYEIWMKKDRCAHNYSNPKGGQTKLIGSRWGEMVYRGARRSDIATQGKATADDLHMGMDDRWQRKVWDGSHGSHTTVRIILQTHGAQCCWRCL